MPWTLFQTTVFETCVLVSDLDNMVIDTYSTSPVLQIHHFETTFS